MHIVQQKVRATIIFKNGKGRGKKYIENVNNKTIIHNNYLNESKVA